MGGGQSAWLYSKPGRKTADELLDGGDRLFMKKWELVADDGTGDGEDATGRSTKPLRDGADKNRSIDSCSGDRFMPINPSPMCPLGRGDGVFRLESVERRPLP